MSDGYKKCCDCKQLKLQETEFSSGQSVCKQCAKIRRAEWGKRNLDHLREYNNKRRRERGAKEARLYSKAEVAYLQEHYSIDGTASIATFLGRTQPSVNQMARRLKLKKPDKVSRFWAKVHKTDTCWIWTARKDQDGYGQVRFNWKMLQAHRLAWELTNGPIPKDMFVCHNCPEGDNPSCVNPAHLWLGTAAENNWDKVRKGRHSNGRR